MIYGVPAWDIVGDSTDRIGIRTLSLSKFWQAKNWSATSVDPQLDPNFPAAPPVSGGVILIGEETRRKGGGFVTIWTFEGINGNGQSVTFKTRQNSLDYQFDPGFSQVSIQLLPNFQDLVAAYGGQLTGDSVLWPAAIPGGAGGASGFGASAAAGQPNPMFGVQDYLRLEGTYSFRYASLTPPEDTAVGTVLTGGLPGNAPDYSGGGSDSARNWLMAPSPWKRRGPVYDITEIYWLSGPGGWPSAVYGGGSGSSGDASNFGFNFGTSGLGVTPGVSAT